MADVGVMGLGKLGLIMAMVLDVHGKHNVYGYDVTTRPGDILAGRVEPPQEADIEGLLERNKVTIVGSPDLLVANSDVIFVVVQTPHPSHLDGTVPIPPELFRDFDYGFLVNAVRMLSRAADEQNKHVTIAVVSTVLPGTCDRLLRPWLHEHVSLVYTPSLIALGSVADDLLSPEFVIVGADTYDAGYEVTKIYTQLHNRPVRTMSIPSAELTKVAYNTYTSMKIVFANTMLELAEKTGADADEVTSALSLATTNLMSRRYLSGGLGGGGYCHPRDVAAMSALARKTELSADLFGFLSQAREDQSGWLASLVRDYHDLTGYPVTILGNAYRPNSNLAGGSAALLLFHQLTQDHWLPVSMVDPHTGTGDEGDLARLTRGGPGVFVIGCGHREFSKLTFAHGSVVIDPVGMVSDQPGVTVLRLGRKR